jgi:predicted phosphodiesterase
MRSIGQHGRGSGASMRSTRDLRRVGTLGVIVFLAAAACSSGSTGADGAAGTTSVETATGTAPAPGQLITGQYAWVQLGSGTRVEVRALADGPCPDATVDDRAVPMSVFMPATDAFPHTTCVAEVPLETRSIAVGTHQLPPPARKLDRVVVVGDIGCTTTPESQQDCFNGFPARQVAERIAAEKPDLVVFTGDIFYSETECTEPANCEGVPYGDNWPTWAYDFFDPYRSALDTAPWIFVRGNHESCATQGNDGGPGWFQILAPQPSTCQNFTDPFRVDVADQSFVVFDSALANDNPATASQVPEYAAMFTKVHDLAAGHPDAWFVDHRPLWSTGGTTPSDTLNLTLQAAIAQSGNTIGSDVSLILSGHVHAMGVFTVSDGRPPQLISGGGGTELETNKAGTFTGVPIDGSTFSLAWQEADWGYVRMDRALEGWDVAYQQYASGSWSRSLACVFADRTLTCPN